MIVSTYASCETLTLNEIFFSLTIDKKREKENKINIAMSYGSAATTYPIYTFHCKGL
jgi:hypothetical protein